MCSWFPVLEKFCFRFDLRTGLYAVAALRTFIWFVFIIVAVANYASRERVAEEKQLPHDEMLKLADEILASNVTNVFSTDKETADEAGEIIHEGSAENVDKDKRKEASIYGAFAVVIIFVVGLFSEILLGIGTRFAIIWPLIVWLCVSSIILIVTVGLLASEGETDMVELSLELSLAVFQLYCTWMVYSEIMHLKERQAAVENPPTAGAAAALSSEPRNGPSRRWLRYIRDCWHDMYF